MKSAIAKSLSRAPKGTPDDAPAITIEIDATPTTEENEDGSITVDLSGDTDKFLKQMTTGFGDNLAEKLDDMTLRKIGDDLKSDIEADQQSRSDWEKTLKDGLKLLGLRIEERTEPWEGACGVVHPILTEAVVRFQSEMMTETFPPAGPVKSKILGKETPEKHDAAERVRTDMNIELTDRMTEYRREHERLLWNLPIAGCALKKIYFDPDLSRQASMFVAAEDFIVSNGTTDLRTCPRYTQVMKITRNDLRKLQVSGVYKDISLDDPTPEANDVVKNEKDKLSGTTASIKTEHYTLYETCVDLVIDGLSDSKDDVACPYVVTIEKNSGIVLALRRNWDEDDESKQKKQYFVDYQYIPGFGFYGFGLIHLVGGFAEGATSILRQLVDAGTLSNLPGGMKTRGMRIKGDDTPIAPGEWRDVDVPSGMLKENLMPLPYKEPSVVLAQLLETIVDEGRKLAAVAEMKIQDFDSNSPVGTTMALLERTLKVMTAVQSRIFDSMKYEFRIIKQLVMEFGADTYEYDPETGDRSMRKDDYKSVDILPVADPNAATMSQRIVQWQAIMQLVQMAPQIYDLPQTHGRMLTVLGIQDSDALIPALRAQNAPRDPVTENMSILNMQPVKAFPYQNHQAHITVHMSLMQDPMVQQMIGQNPLAPQIMAAAQAHLVEHIAFEYRNQIEQQLGTQLPPMDQPLPPAIEYQLSGLVAQASGKLLGQNQALAAMQAQQQQMNDPIAQQQAADTQVRMQEVQRKAAKDQADNSFRQQELALKQQIEQSKLTLEQKKLILESSLKAVTQAAQLHEGAQDRALQLHQQAHDTVMQAQQDAHQTKADAASQQRDHAHDLQQAQIEHQQSLQQAAQQHAHSMQQGAQQAQVQAQQTAMQQSHDRNMAAANQAAQQESATMQRAHDANQSEANRQHQSQQTEMKAKAAPKKPAAKKAKPKE